MSNINGVSVLKGNVVIKSLDSGEELPTVGLRPDRVFILVAESNGNEPGLYHYTGTAWENVSNVGYIDGITVGDGLVGGGTAGSVTLAVDNTVARTSTISTIQSNRLHKDGSIVMTGALDLGTNKILHVSTPTVGSDAANKSYVDSAITSSPFLPIAGGTLTGGIALSNNKIANLGTPTVDGDAANKAYVDYAVSQNNGNTITIVAQTGLTGGGTGDNLNIGIDTNVVATVTQIAGLQDNKLGLSGGVMSGDIDMDNVVTIVNVPSPTDDTDVANKEYVDEFINNLDGSVDDTDGAAFIVLNSFNVTKALGKSSINVSGFNNDIGYIVTDVTGSIAPVMTVDGFDFIRKTSVNGGSASVSTNNSLIIAAGDSTDTEIEDNVTLTAKDLHLAAHSAVVIYSNLTDGYDDSHKLTFSTGGVLSIDGNDIYHAGNAGDDLLLLSGGTLTGDLTLPGDPTDDLHAAPKQYVDNSIAFLSEQITNDFGVDANLNQYTRNSIPVE